MKNLIRYLAFALMVGGACAQSNLPPCLGSDISLWSDCYGNWSAKEGDRVVRGLFTQTYTRATGEKYVGEWKNGLFNGFGTYESGGGYKYTGEWKNGKKNGFGSQYIGGDAFHGYFADDIIDGQGVYIRQNGSLTLSEWKKGELYGRFIDYKADKSIERSGIYESGLPVKLQNIEPNFFTELIKLRPELNFINTVVITQPQYSQKPSVTNISSNYKRIALVIGNANYKTRPLRNPRNDADDVSNSLKATGFQVIDLRDASLQQMRNGVRQFGDRLINNDVGLVYYSGHGVEVKGRNYFIPVNADIQREDEIADQGLDVSLILEKMNTAGKGVNILIVDACRDDPFGRSFRSSSRGLAQMDAPRGTIIAYATSPGKVAADGDGRNSPYTKNLLNAMQQPNKPIEQVFKEVRRAVQEETKNQQTPWENTSLSGDFYFRVQK